MSDTSPDPQSQTPDAGPTAENQSAAGSTSIGADELAAAFAAAGFEAPASDADAPPPQPSPPAAEARAAAAPDPASAARPFEAVRFEASQSAGELAALSLLDDVELDVQIELGRTEMYIEDVLRLGEGSVIELDKLAGDPVDIYVNSKLVARGEVLVLNENFCVRINDIISPIPELDGHK